MIIKNDISGCTFSNGIDLPRVILPKGLNLSKCHFNQRVSLEGAKFSGDVNLSGFTFRAEFLFEKVNVEDGQVNFTGCNFTKAKFSGIKIHGRFCLDDITMTGDGAFSLMKCDGEFSAKNAQFGGILVCGGAQFGGLVDFEGAKIKNTSHWYNITSDEYFRMVNCAIDNTMNFRDAKFKKCPPQFEGAKMHEGTDWGGVTWPKNYQAEDATLAVRCFERLRSESEKLKKYEDGLKLIVE